MKEDKRKGIQKLNQVEDNVRKIKRRGLDGQDTCRKSIPELWATQMLSFSVNDLYGKNDNF